MPTCHFFSVQVAATGLSIPSPLCSSCRRDSFEGQSQWEWDGPSDEHQLPSTSVGFHCLCRLITLQSSAEALHAVNYFTEQCGDVPSCEHERERVEISTSWSETKKMRQKKKKCEKNGVERETKSETLRKERGLEGASERPASHNVTSDSLYSRRQASTNEQSYKLIRQRQGSEKEGKG